MRIPVLILLLCTLLSPLRGEDGFETRARRLLDVAAGEEEFSFYSCAAKIRLGRDLPRAYAILDSMTRDVSMGGMFYAYSLMGAYLHSRDNLPDSLHQKVREAFRVRTMYRGDTENHWVMYYTGIYLAAQTWPGEEGKRWFNGRSSGENFREAKEWLEEWIRISTTMGQGEFDSPTYMNVYISPMLVLHEFARDPMMKRRAGMMLDLLIADFAAECLAGAYCGGHSRDYPDDIINPLSAPATRISWLFFGMPADENWNDERYRPRHRGSWETVFAALGSYRLPDVVYRMSTDRSAPYVHAETKRVRNIIRYSDVKNPPVYKYTYMTADYALGSLQGGILQPIQQHTWDVTFNSGKPNNTIFSLHPFVSGKELAMFFPEEVKFLAGEVDRYHLVYTNPGKWNSSSPYEQVAQHRNALIALYRIPAHARQPHIDAFFPKNLDERILDPSGWIFARAGDVYVAVRPLKGGEWIEEKVNWRFRSRELTNGLVVEVGSAAEHGVFERFREKVRTARLKYPRFDTDQSVEYVTTGGDRIRFRYGKPLEVNGRRAVRRPDRLFDGPFMSAEVGSGVITLRHGRQSRVLDFPRARVEDRP